MSFMNSAKILLTPLPMPIMAAGTVRFNPKLDGNLSIAAGQVSDEIDFSVDDEVGLDTKLRGHHLGC